MSAPGQMRKGDPIVWIIQVGVFLVFLIMTKGLNLISPIIPEPSVLISSLGGLLKGGAFYQNIGITLYESFSGLALATLIGCACGISIGANKSATDFFNPILLAFYAVPKIIFLPILLIIFGPGLSAKIANATIHAVFPIILSAMLGMRQIPTVQLAVARSMLATRSQMIWKIYLPNMKLPLLTGIKLGTGLALMGALLAELFESKSGVGFLINQLYSRGQIAEMLSLIFIIFVLILCINALLKFLQGNLSGWKV